MAEGLTRASEKFSEEAQSKISHEMIPNGEGDMDAPRAYVANSLLLAMEPRMHMHLRHELAFIKAHWMVHTMAPQASPIDWKTYRAAAKLFFGSEAAADIDTYEGKSLAALKTQNRTYLKDSLGLCDFAWPICVSFNTEDHLGDPTLEGKIYSAVTGNAMEELDQFADRIFTLQRAIMYNEGWRGVKDDIIPEYNFTEPFETDGLGREITYPGPDGEIRSAKGNILNRQKFFEMRKEYYKLRGWDQETGKPLAKTLERLEIQDLADSFAL